MVQKNNKSALIRMVTILMLSLVITCFYVTCKSPSTNTISNERIIEYYLQMDDSNKLAKDRILNSFAIKVSDSFKNSKHPITSIIKKIYIGKEEKYSVLIVISRLDENRSTIQLNKYMAKKVTCKNLILNTENLEGFFGVCDDHYFNIKSKNELDLTNYSYLFVNDGKIFFTNIIADSLGIDLNKIKGKCSPSLIEGNMKYINEIIGKFEK